MAPSRSQRSAWGRISAATKSRNSSRAERCTTVSSSFMVSSGRRRCALARHETRDRPDGTEVVEVEVGVLDLDVELLLDEGDELHGEQRAHETQGKDVLVRLQVVAFEEPRQELLDLELNLVHGGNPSR